MDNAIYEAAVKALYVAVLISLVPVTTATVSGFVIAIFQTLTQIQEQTLPFFFKMISTFSVLYAASSWASSALLEYSREIYELIGL
jgi:type III secretion protein S